MTTGTVHRSVHFVFAWVLASGCSMNVAQDAKSGPDAKAKGAKKIRIGDDGEGVAKGVVTYPGGDRVDWKMFEIPKAGDVELALKWEPAREGEDLSFNLLDDTFHVVRRVAPAPDSGKTVKKAELSLQPGKYYLQIYASARGDAGEYEMKVHWSESRGPVVLNADPLPNPPRLPAVPGIVASGGGGGGAGGADKSKPKGSKENPCQVGEQCPQGALFVNPACPQADPMPIGSPCPPQPVVNPACPEAGPLAPGAPCPQVKKAARITERQQQGLEVMITIDKGTKQGIQKGFTGVVFKGKTGATPLPNGEFVIFKVTDNESYAKLKKVTLGDLAENTRVELTSPPPK